MPLGKQDIAQHFAQRFGQVPRWVVRAPGRVNLIGEHTDYNDGFVLPLAIDRAVWIALRPRSDRRVAVHSIDYNESAEFELNGMVHQKAGWIEYLKGVAWALHDAGYTLTGWEGVLSGDVPLGAGLSSSAAVEMATARAFAVAGGLPWDPAAMAKLGQRAENKWIGVNCGIMDQMISASGPGRPRHADRLPLAADAAGAAAGRRGGGGAGHLDPPRAGRFGLQRAAGPVRGGGQVLRRQGAARRDAGVVPAAGRPSWTRPPAAVPGTSSPRTSGRSAPSRRCAAATSPRWAS